MTKEEAFDAMAKRIGIRLEAVRRQEDDLEKEIIKLQRAKDCAQAARVELERFLDFVEDLENKA